jgi:2-oxoacid:acceptor oxidoreductase gamma subunit (pyruvate/2-ketoisovalerate family)
VVTAAELLAAAAFSEGSHAQAFPSFGSDRMGAPVMSFCRIDDKPIRTHEPVTEPDALIVQDPTLLHQADLPAGLTSTGYMLVNSTHDFGELGLAEFVSEFRPERLVAVPASALAMTHLERALHQVAGHSPRACGPRSTRGPSPSCSRWPPASGDMLSEWGRSTQRCGSYRKSRTGTPARVLASLSARPDLTVIGRRTGASIGSVRSVVLGHAHGPIAVVPSTQPWPAGGRPLRGRQCRRPGR